MLRKGEISMSKNELEMEGGTFMNNNTKKTATRHFGVTDDVQDYYDNYKDEVYRLPFGAIAEIVNCYKPEDLSIMEFVDTCIFANLFKQDWFINQPIIRRLGNDFKDCFILEICGKCENDCHIWMVFAIEFHENTEDSVTIGVDFIDERDFSPGGLHGINTVADIIPLIELHTDLLSYPTLI